MSAHKVAAAKTAPTGNSPRPQARFKAIALTVLLLLGLFACMLPRALFFTGPKSYAVMVVLMLAVLWVWVQGQIELPALRTSVGLALLIGGVAVVSTLLWAANRGDALVGLLLFMAAGLLLLIGRSSGLWEWMPEATAVTVTGTAAFLTLFALGHAAALYRFQDAVLATRLASTLQYPNSFGGYEIAAFIGLATVGRYLRWWQQPLLFLTALGTVLSASRGAWLFGALVLVLVAVLNWRRASDWVVTALIPLALALVCSVSLQKVMPSPGVNPVFSTHNLMTIVLWTCGGMVLSAALAHVWSLHTARVAERTRLITTLVVLTGGLVLLVTVGTQVAGLQILQRLSLLLSGGTDVSDYMRLQSMKDGLKIFAQAPMGLGWGGWHARYTEFESFGYIINFPHSVIEQVAVDYGVLGLGTFLFLGGWLLWRTVRLRVQQSGEATPRALYQQALGWGVIALTAHACIDVNFAFGGIVLTTFLMLGVFAAGDEATRWSPASRPMRLAMLALWGVLLFAGVRVSLGQFESMLGKQALGAGAYELAVVHYRKAAALNGWDPEVWEPYRQALVGRVQGKLNLQDTQEFLDTLRRQLAAFPTNAGARLSMGDFYVKTGNYPAALAEFSRAVELDPWRVDNYVFLLQGQLLAAQTSQDPAVVHSYLEAARETVRRFDAQVAKEPANIGPYAMNRQHPGWLKLRAQVQ